MKPKLQTLIPLLLSALALLMSTRPGGVSASSLLAIAATRADERNPDVAYDAVTDRYLIVWENRRTGQVMGEIRQGDGTIFRNDFVIFPASPEITHTDPAVTFKSGHNLYFVVAKQRSGTTAQIIGRRVSASGTLLDFGFFLSLPDNAAAFEGRPDVAAVTSGSNCCILAVWKQSNTIRGRHIRGDASLEGPSFIITTVFTDLFSPGTTAPTPAVVYQSRRNEFLVVYGALPGLTAPTGPYVARRIVPPGSGTSSGELRLSQADTPDNPDIAYNERANTYLVTWNDRGVPYGQLLNQFGNLLGSRFRMTALLTFYPRS
jgi:hypothetical protein